jgi:hypothetical protein
VAGGIAKVVLEVAESILAEGDEKGALTEASLEERAGDAWALVLELKLCLLALDHVGNVEVGGGVVGLVIEGHEAGVPAEEGIGGFGDGAGGIAGV